MTNTDYLEEIAARADRATPGPWMHDDNGSYMGCGEVYTMGEHVEGGNIAAPSGDLYPRSGYSPKDDMVFIAHAREDVPALLEALKNSKIDAWDEAISVLGDLQDALVSSSDDVGGYLVAAVLERSIAIIETLKGGLVS